MPAPLEERPAAPQDDGRGEQQFKPRQPRFHGAAMKVCGHNMLPMAIASKGAVRARLIQNRRVMSRSSGLSSSTVTVRGSSAMPQIGQFPGSGSHDLGMHRAHELALSRGEHRGLGIERHSTLGTGARPGLPHLGAHGTNKGSPVFFRTRRQRNNRRCGRFAQCWHYQGWTTQRHQSDVTVVVIGLGGDDRIFSGFAWNFARQPAQQKKYSLLWCSVLKRAVAGFTSIPQTGSFCLVEDDATFGCPQGQGGP